MLLPWRKTISLVLSPGNLTVHSGKQIDNHLLTVGNNSSALMAEVAEHLIPYQKSLKTASVKVILSNHFVRYAIVPWRQGINSNKDWHAIALNQLRQLYGAMTANMKVEVILQGYGQPLLAAAIDKVIAEQFDALAKQQQWQLKSVEPAFITVLNRYASSLDRNGWLLIAEPERLLLAQARKGSWQRFSVAMPPVAEADRQAFNLLMQAQQREESQFKAKVYVYGDEYVSISHLATDFELKTLTDNKTASASEYHGYGALI